MANSKLNFKKSRSNKGDIIAVHFQTNTTY
jgi:hypothetical protein